MFAFHLSGFIPIYILLMGAHAFFDFPGQGDYLASAKNPLLPAGKGIWPWTMSMHAWMHAAAVYVITGSLLCCVLEFLLHYVIDLSKCYKRISFFADQLLHALCKVLWALIASGALVGFHVGIH